jgi:hypothetical protein
MLGTRIAEEYAPPSVGGSLIAPVHAFYEFYNENISLECSANAEYREFHERMLMTEHADIPLEFETRSQRYDLARLILS